MRSPLTGKVRAEMAVRLSQLLGDQYTMLMGITPLAENNVDEARVNWWYVDVQDKDSGDVGRIHLMFTPHIESLS